MLGTTDMTLQSGDVTSHPHNNLDPHSSRKKGWPRNEKLELKNKEERLPIHKQDFCLDCSSLNDMTLSSYECVIPLPSLCSVCCHGVTDDRGLGRDASGWTNFKLSLKALWYWKLHTWNFHTFCSAVVTAFLGSDLTGALTTHLCGKIFSHLRTMKYRGLHLKSWRDFSSHNFSTSLWLWNK